MCMENYKGVIFDFNGTLFFDNPKHILAWSKWPKKFEDMGLRKRNCMNI